MKLVAIIMSVLLSSFSFAVAQGNPSGLSRVIPLRAPLNPVPIPPRRGVSQIILAAAVRRPLAVKTTMETRGGTRCRRVT